MPSFREELIRILNYYDISYNVQTRNAINITCPFCDDEENHLGIFVDNLRYTCWHCKQSGTLYDLLHELYSVTYQEYVALLDHELPTEHKSALSQIKEILGQNDEEQNSPGDVKWPPEGTVPISKMRNDLLTLDFLKGRRLKQEFCEEKGVQIGVVGRYTGRFIIPVHNEGRVVAYQARDMTGQFDARYLTEGEVSYYLYNFDNADPNLPIPITEGVISSWFTDYNAVASFTTALSPHQINLMLSKNPPCWILCWDIGEDGSDAFWKARPVMQNLSGQFGPGKVKYVTLPPKKDPADLGWHEMQYLLQKAIPI